VSISNQNSTPTPTPTPTITQLDFVALFIECYTAIESIHKQPLSRQQEYTNRLEFQFWHIVAKYFNLYRYSSKEANRNNLFIVLVDLNQDFGLVLKDGALADIKTRVNPDTTNDSNDSNDSTDYILIVEFGIDYEEYLDKSNTTVVSEMALRLSHEITHALQFSRVPYKNRHLPLTAKSEIRKDTLDSLQLPSYVHEGIQYLSSFHEIDAHSTSVVLELFQVTNTRKEAKQLLKKYLSAPVSIPQGTSLHSFYSTLKQLKTAHHEIEHSWHRFLKKIFKYLMSEEPTAPVTIRSATDKKLTRLPNLNTTIRPKLP